ncbi:MAG: hypothetical protein JNM31_12680 [Flavobacteriales bacterium]|nr:hypothetical protein [Flavobacteriales bacterium]
MLKKLLTLSFFLGLLTGQAQVIFFVQEPASLEGNYAMTWTTPAGGWGSPDLTIPANAVTDTLAFVDDGSTADSLGCNTLVNVADITGKIAVVYRGACEFGVKALNAQTAGAVAVVVINNSGAPIAMGPGVQGANVTIPAVMISEADGALLRDEIMAGNVVAFIGSIQGFYANDVGFFRTDVLFPKFGAIPELVAQSASEFNFQLGVWLKNFGSNDQTGIVVTADVSQSGSSVFTTSSSAVALVSGDSAYVDLGIFSMASYSGHYTLTYSVTMPNTDEFSGNDSHQSTFSVGEIFSHAPTNEIDGLPTSSGTVSPGATPAPEVFTHCIHFRDANASRLGTTGMWFSAAPVTIGADMSGSVFAVEAYEWLDVFTGMTDVVSPPTLNLVAAGEYTYLSNLPNENVFAPFTTQIPLVNNQRYLFCVTSYSSAYRLGFNSTVHLDRNQTFYDQPIMTVNYGTNWFVGGYTGGGAAAQGVAMIPVEAIGLDEPSPTTIHPPYPNPTSTHLWIPLRASDGPVTVEFIDQQGRFIASRSAMVSSDRLEVNVADIAPGRYTVRLVNTTTHTEPRVFGVVIGR